MGPGCYVDRVADTFSRIHNYDIGFKPKLQNSAQ